MFSRASHSFEGFVSSSGCFVSICICSVLLDRWGNFGFGSTRSLHNWACVVWRTCTKWFRKTGFATLTQLLYLNTGCKIWRRVYTIHCCDRFHSHPVEVPSPPLVKIWMQTLTAWEPACTGTRHWEERKRKVPSVSTDIHRHLNLHIRSVYGKMLAISPPGNRPTWPQSKA